VVRCWYVKLSSKVFFFSPGIIGVDGTMVEAFVGLDRWAESFRF
jgi:hypothetical protein